MKRIYRYRQRVSSFAPAYIVLHVAAELNAQGGFDSTFGGIGSNGCMSTLSATMSKFPGRGAIVRGAPPKDRPGIFLRMEKIKIFVDWDYVCLVDAVRDLIFPPPKWAVLRPRMPKLSTRGGGATTYPEMYFQFLGFSAQNVQLSLMSMGDSVTPPAALFHTPSEGLARGPE